MNLCYLFLKLFDSVAALLGFDLSLLNFSDQLSISLGKLNNLGSRYIPCDT